MVKSVNSNSPPQSLDVEASLLGSLLIDSDAFIKIADQMQPDDFFDEKHKLIFTAMQNLHNRSVFSEVSLQPANYFGREFQICELQISEQF